MPLGIQWVSSQKGGKKHVDHSAFGEFLWVSVTTQLMEAGWSVIDQNIEWIKEDLSRGFRAFEVDPDTALRETTEKVIAGLRRVVDGFPRSVRNAVTLERWNAEMLIVEWELAGRIPHRVTGPRMRLTDEFEENCKTTYKRLEEEAEFGINVWNAWSPEIEGEWLRRFSDAVHYNEFPAEMQDALAGAYSYWLDTVTILVRNEVEMVHRTPNRLLFFLFVFAGCVGSLAIIAIILRPHREAA
jgi:hypothetical protein